MASQGPNTHRLEPLRAHFQNADSVSGTSGNSLPSIAELKKKRLKKGTELVINEIETDSGKIFTDN